jgi:hypothetical protein
MRSEWFLGLSPPTMSFATTPPNAASFPNFKDAVVLTAGGSGRRTHSAQTSSWWIAPSICSNLISDRDRH